MSSQEIHMISTQRNILATEWRAVPLYSVISTIQLRIWYKSGQLMFLRRTKFYRFICTILNRNNFSPIPKSSILVHFRAQSRTYLTYETASNLNTVTVCSTLLNANRYHSLLCLNTFTFSLSLWEPNAAQEPCLLLSRGNLIDSQCYFFLEMLFLANSWTAATTQAFLHCCT